MKALSTVLGAGAVVAISLGMISVLPPTPAAAQMPVFDTTNYAQNLLQAARALTQINNQVASLQNEASMLGAMTKNLKTVDFPQLQQMTTAMQQIDQLMSQAQGIQFRVQGVDQQVKALFPGALGQALTGNQRVADARARLDAATAGYRQAMGVQSQVAENVSADARILAELAGTSQGAEGALQAQQAANQLLALSVKQQLQLQTLMASQFREASLERARRAQAEEDGRATTRRFLDGAAAPGN